MWFSVVWIVTPEYHMLVPGSERVIQKLYFYHSLHEAFYIASSNNYMIIPLYMTTLVEKATLNIIIIIYHYYYYCSTHIYIYLSYYWRPR